MHLLLIHTFQNRSNKIELSFLQVPKLWESEHKIFADVNPSLRSKFKLEHSGYEACEKLARKFVIELLPTCYLEGYSSICDHIENLNGM